MNPAILSCRVLEDYVAQAQANVGTSYPVFDLDNKYHNDPPTMREHIIATMAEVPDEYDTILVAQGFCGGSWDHVTVSRTTIIPRVDDCVSLLLTTDDVPEPNRKQPGHLYVYEKDPTKFGVDIFTDPDCDDPDAIIPGMNRDSLMEMYFGAYGHLDIIDTGMNDCYSVPYVEAAQATADRLRADLDYVPGGIHLLEKLLTGPWDGQFVVAKPGETIKHGSFFD